MISKMLAPIVREYPSDRQPLGPYSPPPWPTPSLCTIHSQEVVSNQGEQLIFEGEQLTPGSKGYSFYKALFLLAKRANDISFLFTL